MSKIKSLNDIPSIRDYLIRIGAEARSLRTAVVKEQSGSYWRDVGIIRFGKDGSIDAPIAYAPTDGELASIKADCAQYTWPSIKLVKSIPYLHPHLIDAAKEDVFEFRDVHGNLVMIQLRRVMKDGGKAYIPYTFWDDDEWRIAEPDGNLPLWGIDKIGDNTTVFIHEGAKAARAMQRLANGTSALDQEARGRHPWGVEMTGAAHIGWIGGALSPYRTDWSVLAKMGVTRAYIVSDNDAAGRSAVPAISERLRMVTIHVQFTNEWPASFDLADEFPESMFSELEGKRYYNGPRFEQCLHPATWMTDVIPNKKGRPSYVLRDNAKDIWRYVESVDMFVAPDMPGMLYKEKILNNSLSGFSHSNETARLILKSYRGRSPKVCYRPDNPGRIITEKTTSAINLHTPTYIRSIDGNPAPFLEFLDYLFPQEAEREQIERWCATLVARPDIRMEYGLLLVSEKQGMGKTTLGASVLAPLVGYQNFSAPAESLIVDSGFNGWVARKRLIVVNEIYSGHSWKAYNALKSVITDDEIEVNDKFDKTYTIENWAHIIAMSNSMRALRMEKDDRRWFYPEVTEDAWPRLKFTQFQSWLKNGGLGIIKGWAEKHGSYVARGERAPMTRRKNDLIEESRSEAQQAATRLAFALNEETLPTAFTTTAIIMHIRSSVQGKVFDSAHEIRKAMREEGCHQHKSQITVNRQKEFIIMNRALARLVSSEGSDESCSGIIRSHIKAPAAILEHAI